MLKGLGWSLFAAFAGSRPPTYSDLRMVLTGLWHAYLLLDEYSKISTPSGSNSGL
jgi:hypothetical protein